MDSTCSLALRLDKIENVSNLEQMLCDADKAEESWMAWDLKENNPRPGRWPWFGIWEGFLYTLAPASCFS